jgi:secreted trypsin-like serine protease
MKIESTFFFISWLVTWKAALALESFLEANLEAQSAREDVQIQPRIIGGSDALPGEYPFFGKHRE